MPTAIEWCDETFNPWWGCAEVSPGCGHCYARTWARFTRAKLQLWPEHGQASTDHAIAVTADANWREPLKWARTLPDELGRRPRVFTASMADVFEDHPLLVEPRKRLLDLIGGTPELDWLVLTKRPEVAHAHYFAGGWTLTPNLWLGTSIESARYTWRADVLREIPAAVRFISAEPLLSSLYRDRNGEHFSAFVDADNGRAPLDLTGIDWVIVGGESGPKARPFHLEHAREIVDAARADQRELVNGARTRSVQFGGTAVFVKQLGAKPHTIGLTLEGAPPYPMQLRDRKGGDWDEWPADLRIREFPRSAA
jgi:protein gp37